MMFPHRYAYQSAKQLRENLEFGSIIILRALLKKHTIAPADSECFFVSVDIDTGEFLVTLDLKKPNATFKISFYDIAEVWSPEHDTKLYEAGDTRL